jgi:PAS domain S-box-containing protein
VSTSSDHRCFEAIRPEHLRIPRKFAECPLNGNGVSSGLLGQDDYFREMIEGLPAAIYSTDAAGRITFYNEAAAALWGRRPKIGEDWWCGSWRLFWPDGTPMAHDECPMAVTLKTGRPVRGVEAIAERPDGTRYPFIPYPTPLRDARGKLIGAVNMLLDITERKRVDEDSQLLASIVESADDAIVSKDLNGIIASWNRGAEKLFGYAPEEIVGKPIATLIPPDRQDEEIGILERLRRGERIEHYETIRRRKDGTLVEVSPTISPVSNAEGRIIGASKIARDITERKRSEEQLRQQTRRFETLNRISKTISSDLDLERTVQTVTDTATELSGAKFGALFCNITDGNGESRVLYTVSGAPREAFEEFGWPWNTALFERTFRDTEVIRCDDIRADPRYGKDAPHHDVPKSYLPIASCLVVPIVACSSGTVGGLFLGHDEPWIFKKETEELVTGIAAHAVIAINNARLHHLAQLEIEQRRRAEEAKALLLNEIKHRVKNTLGTVQAIAAQTFHRAPSDERGSFVARLHALAKAHDALTDQNWDRAEVGDIVRRALEPFKDGNRKRIHVAGAETWLNANKSLLLSMALHELGTNALKHGALSNGDGRVSIAWELVEDSQSGRLKFQWRESGGPCVAPPKRKGFGSALIERAFNSEGSAHYEFAPQGISCTLEMTL